MLKYRLLISAVLVPVLGLLFWLDAKTGPTAAAFGPLCIVLSGLAAGELVGMVRNRVPTLTRKDVMIASMSLTLVGWGVHAGPAVAWTGAEAVEQASGLDVGSRLRNVLVRNVDGAGPLANLLEYSGVRRSMRLHGVGDAPATTIAGGLAAAVALAWVLAWLLEAAAKFERGTLEAGQVVAHVSAKLLILAYAGGLVAATMQLRWYGQSAWAGYRLLAGLLVCVKSADVGAYFIGRAFGKTHPLKRLSPGKTEAGFIGAVVVGALAFAAWMSLTRVGDTAVFDLSDRWWAVAWLILLGGLLAVGGVIGDLVESLLKRECGVKDSSSLLPGFGGVLDVLDSVLFVGAAVVALSTAAATLALIAVS